MTLKQFQEATRIAHGGEDLDNVDMSVLDGYGLPGFGPVVAPLRSIARCIRWQTMCFNGSVDTVELQSCWFYFCKRVMVA